MKRHAASLAIGCALVLALGGTATAQYAAPAPPPPPPGAPPPPPPGAVAPLYAPAQLDQMLASIALYPDPLLTSMLTAATYPLEIVEADRWLTIPGNAALSDGTLADALEQQNWDPSVKSLVPFPPVLNMMDQHLDWTEALGNAFLAQPADVMASIQRLRHAAMVTGGLVSTPQATVVVNGPYIEIEPANPPYVYVPVYNPAYVYGAWPYPAYRPIYFGPPPGLGVAVVGGGIGFGLGIATVSVLWNWGNWDWQHHDVRINPQRFNALNRGAPPVRSTVWQHAPEHRRGVPYGDERTRERYAPMHAVQPVAPGVRPQPAPARGRAAPPQPGAERPGPETERRQPPAPQPQHAPPQFQHAPLTQRERAAPPRPGAPRPIPETERRQHVPPPQLQHAQPQHAPQPQSERGSPHPPPGASRRPETRRAPEHAPEHRPPPQGQQDQQQRP